MIASLIRKLKSDADGRGGGKVEMSKKKNSGDEHFPHLKSDVADQDLSSALDGVGPQLYAMPLSWERGFDIISTYSQAHTHK